MKKTVLILLVLAINTFAGYTNIYLGYFNGYNHSLHIEFGESTTYQLIQNGGSDNLKHYTYLSKSEVNKILKASNEGKYINIGIVNNSDYETYENSNSQNMASISEILSQFYWNKKFQFNQQDYNLLKDGSNNFFTDKEIGIAEILECNPENILYDYDDESRLICGMYKDNGEFISFIDDDMHSNNDLYFEDGKQLESATVNENGVTVRKILNLPIASQLKNTVFNIIDFPSLIEKLLRKLGNVIGVIVGGYVCFLVVKKGLKSCRDYLENSERQEKINNGWYEIEQGRFVPPVSDKIPSVVNDGGVWIDVLHDERYVGNMSIENYLEMRWANLYDKYVNESSRLVNTNKRVLDFNQFKALAESRKINASTVDDESFTRQIVDEQLKGSIDTEQKQRRNYKRKYYPRKQYFAIRNYYRRKKTSQPIVNQPVLLPPPVPQQTVVKPDESLTDDEYREKYKSQLDDYIINKTPENKVYIDALMERHRKAHNISKTQWDNSANEFARKADEIERTIPIWEDTDTPF